jgi:hypothetical protein
MSLYQLNYLQLCQKLRQEAGISGSGPTSTLNQSGELARVCDWIQQSYIDIQEKHTDWNFLRRTFSLPLTIGKSVYPVNINNTSSDTTSYPLSNLVDIANWRTDSMRCYLHGSLTFFSNTSIVAGMTITGDISGATAYVFTITESSFSVLNTTGIFTAETVSGSMTVSGITTTGGATVSGPVLTGYNDEQFITYMQWDDFRDFRLRNASRFATGRPINFSIDPDKNLVVWPIPSDVYTIDGEYWMLLKNVRDPCR